MQTVEIEVTNDAWTLLLDSEQTCVTSNTSQPLKLHISATGSPPATLDEPAHDLQPQDFKNLLTLYSMPTGSQAYIRAAVTSPAKLIVTRP